MQIIMCPKLLLIADFLSVLCSRLVPGMAGVFLSRSCCWWRSPVLSSRRLRRRRRMMLLVVVLLLLSLSSPQEHP